MTITLNLPSNVEQAYRDAAETKGVSVNALVRDVVVSHVPHAGSAQRPELVEERGIPVLRSGHPIDPSSVNDTLDAIRQPHGADGNGSGKLCQSRASRRCRREIGNGR